MDLATLIAAAKATVVNPQKLDELHQRLQDAEKKYESQSQAKAPSKEFLSRTYSL